MDFEKPVKHKRRYCREPGCGKIVKSQGLCQRHGAKTKMCRVAGCPKQAQGGFDGMCKSHFNVQQYFTDSDANLVKSCMFLPSESNQVGSVYDRIIPASVAWKKASNDRMPLVQHLRYGFDSLENPGWHRNNERIARELSPVEHVDTPFEEWEQELVQIEALILNGNTDGASFLHLARGWGREEGFHSMVLGRFIIKRCGEVRRSRLRFLEDVQDAIGYENLDSFLDDDFDDSGEKKGDDDAFDSDFSDHEVYPTDFLPFSLNR